MSFECCDSQVDELDQNDTLLPAQYSRFGRESKGRMTKKGFESFKACFQQLHSSRVGEDYIAK